MTARIGIRIGAFPEFVNEHTHVALQNWQMPISTPQAYCLLACSRASAAATTRNCPERILSLLLIYRGMDMDLQ
jgi:hypothetical protein